MLSSKLIRTLTLGLSLAGTAALAEDAAPKSGTVPQLNCPAGTKQFGTPEESIYCRKTISVNGINFAHGPAVSYYPNGQKRFEGQYFEGFRSGTWTFYDETGKQTGRTQFSADSYHGKRVQYFLNGKPRLIEEYVNGKRHGLTQEFSEDGKLVREAQFRDDKQVDAK
ncbi:MAG: toxin-antitoxin system YwqK family antitoxin [Hyalangium sp.]|uniref:toxin-antitoxin system YwqK family antitoxin n=1 Tax=Hyalangium sp. TaxID=2028555 RepID=UPI00389A23CE